MENFDLYDIKRSHNTFLNLIALSFSSKFDLILKVCIRELFKKNKYFD